MARPAAPPMPLPLAVRQAFATNERVNQYLLEHLPPALWRAEPPGGKGRTIAAIVAHVHNVRHMWLVSADRGTAAPPKLDRHTVAVAEARAALKASHAALDRVLERSLAEGARVRGFGGDAVAFVAYLVAHDAHHRGQVCLLARELGQPLPQAAGFGMWEWSSRAKEAPLEAPAAPAARAAASPGAEPPRKPRPTRRKA